MKIYGHKDTNYGCTDTYFWHTPTRESSLAMAPADARCSSMAGEHSYLRHPHPKKAPGYLKHGHRPYTEEQPGRRRWHSREVPVALPPPGQPWAPPREPHAAATARRRNDGSSRVFLGGAVGTLAYLPAEERSGGLRGEGGVAQPSRGRRGKGGGCKEPLWP